MSNSNAPNLIAGMLSIHAVVTRGLKVALDNNDAFAHNGFPDSRSREGYLNYLRCLVLILNAHHRTEDELAFPSFRGRVEAPYDLLTEQHRVLHPMLEEARRLIEDAAVSAQPGEALAELGVVLRGIEELWRPHIAIEEEHFTLEDFAALMPPEEHARLIGEFLKHTQELTGPDYLIVPFLLYNLEPHARAVFAGEMPTLVTEHLAPVVWKEKWGPMQPFLLT